MWPRMDFLDLQQLDRWPNGCHGVNDLANFVSKHKQGRFLTVLSSYRDHSEYLLSTRYTPGFLSGGGGGAWGQFAPP